MSKKLENIFNECLERILAGESIESCLASYPEESAELEPLLRTAIGFSWRASSLVPRPEFKAQARVRLQEAQFYSSQQKHLSQQKQPKRTGFFAWQRGWAFALTAVLVVILLAGTGTVAAASGAMPDEPLYPVKLATEEVRLAFTFSDMDKAKLQTRLVGTRVMEIATMAREGKTEQAIVVTEKLGEHLEKAGYAIGKAEETAVEVKRSGALLQEAVSAPEPLVAPDSGKAEDENAGELSNFFEESTSRNLVVLENALKQAPPQAKPALQRAIEIISERSHQKTQQEPKSNGKSGNEYEDKDRDNGKNGHDHEQGDESKSIPVEPRRVIDETKPNPDSKRAPFEPEPTIADPDQYQPSTTETEGNTGGTKSSPDSR